MKSSILVFLIPISMSIGFCLGEWRAGNIIEDIANAYRVAATKHNTPKFKVGDCVSAYGFSPFKIYEIWQDGELNDYAVQLDANCKEKNRVLCRGSGSAYNINSIDANGKLVECPK